MASKKGLIATFLLLFTGITSLCALSSESPEKISERDEVMYLPNGTALKLLSFGFDNVMADLLWFNAISYFGKHFRTDQRYQWLSHMCNLVVDLDPKASHVYRFGALMLAWEVGAVEQSNMLLTKAMKAMPDDWLYPYLRGFNYLFFLKDSTKAKQDLQLAAAKPGVHPVIAQLAAKKITELDSPDTAAATLQELYDSSTDPMVRSVLREKLEVLLRKKRGAQ